MPTTSNVAWDQRLESFKGRDTAQYVTTSAGLATSCAACRSPFAADEPVSLLVDITQSAAPDGTEYLTFTDAICHRLCSEPSLTIRQVPWRPDILTPVAARMVLSQKSAPGKTRAVPVLAYTLTPVLSFRERGGELTSALVPLLLGQGFQLAFSPDYPDILQQTRPVEAGCSFTLTAQGLLRLSIETEILYRERLDPRNADDAEWRKAAAQGGRVLLIGGDYLEISDTDLDLRAAARHGTLVTGMVSIIGADVFETVRIP
jgi:hypothetical protein